MKGRLHLKRSMFQVQATKGTYNPLNCMSYCRGHLHSNLSYFLGCRSSRQMASLYPLVEWEKLNQP